MALLAHRSTRARFALAALLVLLAGCGGGSPDDEPVTTQPVDCSARPDPCR